MNNLFNILSANSTINLKPLEDFINGITIAYVIIVLIQIICFISIAVNVSKITKTVTQPFQNKKPDYPDKVIELLQAVVSAEQHNTNEIVKLKQEMEKQHNGGTVPGMKSQSTVNQEKIIQLLNEQNQMLLKLVDSTTGEEKRKLMEKWKQAQDILNDM